MACKCIKINLYDTWFLVLWNDVVTVLIGKCCVPSPLWHRAGICSAKTLIGLHWDIWSSFLGLVYSELHVLLMMFPLHCGIELVRIH